MGMIGVDDPLRKRILFPKARLLGFHGTFFFPAEALI